MVKGKIKKTLKDILIGVGMAIIFFLIMGIFYGWFLPPKPSVIVLLAPNITEIKGFAYARLC